MTHSDRTGSPPENRSLPDAPAYAGGVPPASRRSAAFFDLDKTIIARSSALAFSRPFYAGGLITRRAVLRSAYAQFVYLVGGADHDQMERMRRYLSDLCAGWDVQQVRDIVEETIERIVQPAVYTEATALIAEHREAGRDVVIVSASGAEVVEPIGRMLGADRVVATRMVVREGRYTGEVERYVYGQEKAVALAEVAAEAGYDLADCWAYSDSATDLPMLAAVGHPVAVNPDRALRREALARGWPVLRFDHPTTLRSRVAGRFAAPARGPADPHPGLLHHPAAPAALATAVGVGAAATAGIVWAASRRRLVT